MKRVSIIALLLISGFAAPRLDEVRGRAAGGTLWRRGAISPPEADRLYSFSPGLQFGYNAEDSGFSLDASFPIWKRPK